MEIWGRAERFLEGGVWGFERGGGLKVPHSLRVRAMEEYLEKIRRVQWEHTI